MPVAALPAARSKSSANIEEENHDECNAEKPFHN
jgi:hypothetical protein